MKMGRPRREGNDICPRHQVLGFYKPHRRPGKIEVHYTFVHNDRTIREHYVSRAARDQSIANSMDMAQNPFKDLYHGTIAMAQAINRTAYLANKFENKISAYPLDKKEVQEFVNAVKPNVEVLKAMNKMTSLVERKVYALTNNLPVPKDVEHDLSTFYERFEKLQQEIAILDERMLNDPVGVIAEAIEVSSSDPFRKQVTYLFNKFEQPRRLARNAKRNEKLSRWEGRKTNDYTGIDSADPSPDPDPIPA